MHCAPGFLALVFYFLSFPLSLSLSPPFLFLSSCSSFFFPRVLRFTLSYCFWRNNLHIFDKEHMRASTLILSIFCIVFGTTALKSTVYPGYHFEANSSTTSLQEVERIMKKLPDVPHHLAFGASCVFNCIKLSPECLGRPRSKRCIFVFHP